MVKSKSKTYTTSELAKIFNISVVSASRYIVKHNLKPVKTGSHNAKYYDQAVYQQMKKYYLNKPKASEKQSHSVSKDDIIEQLQARIKDQSATIELLKQQLAIKDEQIATANQIADQAQKLDLTTHKQTDKQPQLIEKSENLKEHGFLYNLFH